MTNEALLKHVFIMLSQTNDIDKIFKFLKYHFYFETSLCFDGELDLSRYCIEYIEANKLETYLKEEIK